MNQERFEDRVRQAFAEWRKIEDLPVFEGSDYGLMREAVVNTLGATRGIAGALEPQTASQISHIVQVASRYRVPLYTVSTGRNWGYGSSLPAQDGCVLLSLRRMTRILHFDPDAGTATVEPGVTQAHLYEYLKTHGLPFMVPTTGAGPTCSLIGNALERGYGITPHQDHFDAILNLKAVMADGSLYQSALADLGGHRVDSIFKWKIGPYLDGLFAQSNFGIVTEATLALARKPDATIQFIVFVQDADFEEAIQALRRVKRLLNGSVGGINIMNKRRLLAMVESSDAWKSSEVMSEMELRARARKRRLPDWAVLGGIYVPKELREGAKTVIRNEFRAFARKILFLNRGQVTFFENLLKVVPLSSLERTVRGMSEAMNILEGVPSRVALPLAYLKNPTQPSPASELSPDVDGCGLIWFSPLLPIDAQLARDFTQEVTRVCLAHSIEPLVTLTAISERCFDSTIPLVFNRSSNKHREQARACFDALIEVAREFGVFPYRLDIEASRKYLSLAEETGARATSLRLARKLKESIDPNGILSPGRYGL